MTAEWITIGIAHSKLSRKTTVLVSREQWTPFKSSILLLEVGLRGRFAGHVFKPQNSTEPYWAMISAHHSPQFCWWDIHPLVRKLLMPQSFFQGQEHTLGAAIGVNNLSGFMVNPICYAKYENPDKSPSSLLIWGYMGGSPNSDLFPKWYPVYSSWVLRMRL